MNCANHSEVQAVSYCRECGKPMCVECQRPALGSIYCAEHEPAAAGSPPVSTPPPRSTAEPINIPGTASFAAASPYTAAAPSPYAHDPEVHPILALILGFIPGVGAIYNGQYAKGLIHVVIFGLLVTIASRGAGGWEPMVGLMIAAWIFYMAFEAYHTARKRRYGMPVEELSSVLDVRPTNGRFRAGAIVLIALGVILLLDTTDMIDIDRLMRYWPVGLIALGIYLLYARLHETDNPGGRGVNR